MKSKSDFWLTLHKLASDLAKEGHTDDERTESLVAVLEAMSPATLAVYLENLAAVTGTLNNLEARCKTR
jgi:hypothetical protein